MVASYGSGLSYLSLEDWQVWRVVHSQIQKQECELLMLPGGGEQNWREVKDVHDRWRSDAGMKRNTPSASVFITSLEMSA